MPLPDAFAKIPEDDAMADVRASVPGTLEARRATLEATLPEKKIVKSGAAPDVKVSYAGEPKFEPVPSTEVARAVNTGNDIIQYGDKYYLCYEGMWYVASKPTGPWAATADVPAAIYEIPPSSPSYPVTQVVVVTTDDGEVESSYNGAYAAGMFIGFGVAYYGTGYYYPPYYYGGYYYPYYGSYGHGSWYNPNTGGYGSRSVYYGPVRRLLVQPGLQPEDRPPQLRRDRVGRRRMGERGRNLQPAHRHLDGDRPPLRRRLQHDEDGSHGRRTRRPRDGRQEDDRLRHRHPHDRTQDGAAAAVPRSRASARRAAAIRLRARSKPPAERAATIEGEHQGGQGSTTITGEGGGTSTVDSERNQDGSVSREGSFSKDGQTVNTETRRDGTSSVTKAEGSGGGQAISGSTGLGERTTIAQSGSGDLYAGHDGEVYRKTDDGWQQHGDGGWEDVDTPDRPDRGEGARWRLAALRRLGQSREPQPRCCAQSVGQSGGWHGCRAVRVPVAEHGRRHTGAALELGLFEAQPRCSGA